MLIILFRFFSQFQDKLLPSKCARKPDSQMQSPQWKSLRHRESCENHCSRFVHFQRHIFKNETPNRIMIQSKWLYQKICF